MFVKENVDYLMRDSGSPCVFIIQFFPSRFLRQICGTDKEKVRRWTSNDGHLQSIKLGTFQEQRDFPGIRDFPGTRDFPEREFSQSPTSCFVDYGTGLINYFCRDSV